MSDNSDYCLVLSSYCTSHIGSRVDQSSTKTAIE